MDTRQRYDGNGRTGRIISMLYPVVNGLLDLPILYLSRYITRKKPECHRLLRGIRDNADAAAWEQWVPYILKGIEETAGAGDGRRVVEGMNGCVRFRRDG